jgi:hypothetical protein
VCDCWLLVNQTHPRQATGLTIHLGNQGALSRTGGPGRQPRPPITIGALALVSIRTAEGIRRILKGAKAQIAVHHPLVRPEASDGYRTPLQISVSA